MPCKLNLFVVLDPSTSQIVDIRAPQCHTLALYFLSSVGTHQPMDSAMQAVDEGESIMDVVEYLNSHRDQGVPGVYAIYDTHRAPQLISFSEDMFSQIKVGLNAPMGRAIACGG
jgi:hypothetical protein